MHCFFSNYIHFLMVFTYFCCAHSNEVAMEEGEILFPEHRETTNQWWRSLRVFLKVCSPMGKSQIECQC